MPIPRSPGALCAAALLALTACPGPVLVDAGVADADLRDGTAPGDGGAAADGSTPVDASAGDATTADRAPAADASADAGPDAGAGEDAGLTLQVLASFTDSQHAVLTSHGKIYAVSSATDQVLVFDAVTGSALTSIAVGRVPGKLVTDGALLFVVNRLARELGEAYVSLVDPGTDAVIDTLDVEVKIEGSDPDNYPMTNFPWDATAAGGTLFVDFPTNAIPDVRPVTIATRSEGVAWAAGSGPGDLRAAGGKIFVVQGRVISNPDDDALAVHDVGGAHLATLETGGRLHDLVEAEGKIWAALAPGNGAGDALVVVDVATLSERRVEVASGPYGLAVHAGRVYALCQYANAVDVIDAASEVRVERIPLGGLTPAVVNGRGLAVTETGDLVIEADGLVALVRRR